MRKDSVETLFALKSLYLVQLSTFWNKNVQSFELVFVRFLVFLELKKGLNFSQYLWITAAKMHTRIQQKSQI